MFDQIFFSQSKTFKVALREKPLFQTPSFLISYFFNVVQAQKYILVLFIAAYKQQPYSIETANFKLLSINYCIILKRETKVIKLIKVFLRVIKQCKNRLFSILRV